MVNFLRWRLQKDCSENMKGLDREHGRRVVPAA